GVAVSEKDAQVEIAGVGEARQVGEIAPAIGRPVLRDHRRLRGPTGLSGQPLDRRRLLLAEARLGVTVTQIAAPVEARLAQRESPDVEALARKVLGGADELHVVVEGHAFGEALGRHDSLSSDSRLRERIWSFSSCVRLFKPCTQVTGEGCHGTNGQSLPSTTRSTPTSSIRKRSAFSLPTTVS